MSTARTMYWLVNEGLSRPPTIEKMRAKRILAEDETAGCIIMEGNHYPINESQVERWPNQLQERYHDLRHMLGRSLSNPSEPPTPKISIDVGADGEISLYGIISTEKICYITVAAVNVGEAVENRNPTLELRDLEASISDRLTSTVSTTQEPVSDAFADFLLRRTPSRATQLQSTWTREARDFVNKSDLDGIRTFIAELIERRTEWALTLRFADQLDDKPSRAAAIEALGAIDALNTSLASLLTAELIRAAQESDAQDKKAKSAEENLRQHRDYRITRWVAAAVLPTLWLTYWASKPAPAWEGLWPNIVIILVTFGLAPAGYIIIGVIAGRISRNEKSHADENRSA